MKKLLIIFNFVLSLILCTSCYGVYESTYVTPDDVYVTTSIRTINYTYYDYIYDYPIIYVNSIPNYVIWSVDRWIYKPVPRDRYIYIRNYDRPHIWKSNYRMHRDIERIRDNHMPPSYNHNARPNNPPRINNTPARQPEQRPQNQPRHIQPEQRPQIHQQPQIRQQAPIKNGGINRSTGRR